MSVSRCLLIDRTAKIKHPDDSCRTKIEVLSYDLNQLLIRNLASSEGIYSDRGGLCNANRIGKLDLTLISQSCCYDILCYITCCISCRTVYLGAVLTRESTAAVTCISAVGIYNDLTSGKTCVSVRSTDYETACRIDEVFGILIQKLLRKDRIKYILLNILVNLLLCYIRIMLGRKHNSLQTDGLAILIILYRHLALSIGTQIRQGSVLTDICELLCKLVCKGDGIRHILFCFVGCITKHHTLIAGTDGLDLLIRHLVLLGLQCLVNAHGDI